MNNYQFEIGLKKHELDTPALLLDLNVLERNLHKMAEFFKGRDVKLRPHVKLHKATPVLAHMQLQAGNAIGLTCAKLSEAETLVKAGIRDVLIANQIVGHRKIERLVNLAAYSDVMVAVDDFENVRELSEHAQAKGINLRVLVEVNVGHNRCGVAPFGPALELARAVDQAPGLLFKGLMGYDGHCTMRVEAGERENCSLKAMQLLVNTKKFVEEAGLPVEIVSGSGTFTYKYAANVPGITEIQAGTYLLMDMAFYQAGVIDFEPTLTILGTVTSRPTYPGAENLAIIDVGRKAIDLSYGIPRVKTPSGATISGLSQEHSRVLLEGTANKLKVADKMEIWVQDANGTVNLYDKFYALRDDTVEGVWDIPARGQAT